MANFRPLTLQSGDNKQQQDADTLIIGAGITTAAGNLTINSAGGTTTLSDGTLSVSSATTFSAAGTAVTIDNNMTVTGTSTHGGVINANANIERSTSGVLNLGTTSNTTAMTLGRAGITVTVAGDLNVSGTEAVTGTTTFTAGVTFLGTVTIGDGTGVDTLAFDGTSGFLGSASLPNVSFLKEVNHTLNVAQSTSASTAGATLTISSGAGTAGVGGAAGAAGGAMTLASGAGGAGTATAVGGIGGALTVSGGAAGADNGGGGASGGALNLRGGAKSGAGTNGAVNIGDSATSSIGIGASGVTTTVTGTFTIASSSELNTTGTGMIDLPSLFQINNVAVSANVTAANLTELTGGGVTTLHSHSGSDAGTLVQAGLTLWSTPASGEIGYVSGDDTVAKAIATALSTSRFFGVYAGTASTLTTAGTKPMLFVSGLTSITAGTPVFISATTAGRVTKTAPSSGGQVVAEVGLLLDGSGYNNGAGSAHDVLIQVKPPVVL
jgi:hypothetical protein